MNPEAYARRMRGSVWARPGAAAQLSPVPELSFDDLLTEEERALVAASRQKQQMEQQSGPDGSKQQQETQS